MTDEPFDRGSRDPEPPELPATNTFGLAGDSCGNIGPYRILQKIGEGGMGEVYEAEQQKPIRRRVALKLIKLGMDSRQVVARFESERQALALMNHPNVAKVFDAGATPDGRPYFAMEYVKGEAVTEYCDRHRLTTPERLDLFLALCEGVQHAHQKGLIHRDLKPSNMLVAIENGSPAPKIIDFGVAKATAQRLTEKTVATQLGVPIGTPGYMSPEQAEMTGLDVDTRTDVYALGVVLYELLVGALPLDPQEILQAGLDEFRRRVREEDPCRPSTRIGTNGGKQSAESAYQRQTDPASLRRELAGDLDWITMKALEKDRMRRYGSPQELAADIRRHLADEPVLASPPNAAYRARKFVRRHRLGVGGAVIGVVVLLAFAVSMALQAGRIARERNRADKERESAERVAEFLADMLGGVEPDRLGASLWRDLRGRLERSQRQRGATEEQIEQSLATFGELMSGVNPTDAALRLIGEEILARAGRAIATELVEDPRIASQLSNTIGRTYMELGLYEQAEDHLRGALSTREHLFGHDHPAALESSYEMGELLWRRGKLEEAETYWRRTLEGRRRVLGDDHPDTLESIGVMGLLLKDQGKLEQAEPFCREAMEGHRRTLGNHHPDTLTSINNMGSLLKAQGKLEAAEPYYREALEGRRALGNNRRDTLTCVNNLGVLLKTQGKLEQAEPYYREALEGNRRLLGGGHPHTLTAISNMGSLLKAQGKLEEAEPYYREALEGRRRVLGGGHLDTLVSINSLGTLLHSQGKPKEAERVFREVLAVRREALAPHHWIIADTMSRLGESLAGQGLYEEAEPLLLEAHATIQPPERLQSRKHEALERIVKLYEAWGRPEKAAEWRAKLPAS